MKVVLMVGGFGTRLRPLTINIPKPMVPMCNRPLLYHTLHLLKKHDLTDLTGVVYYQPEVIKSYFNDGKEFGVKLDYVNAESDLGTAGSVKNAEATLKDTFMVMSGDVLTDFDLKRAIEFHRAKKAMATMVLTHVENPLAYGVVITDKEHRIVRFLEKPSWGEVFSDAVNTGIYILEPEIFSLIPKGKEFDFSRNLYPLMLEKKLPLFGYIAEGYWKDVGNLLEYRLAHRDILKGEVEIKIPGSRQGRIGKEIWVDEGSKVDGQAMLKESVVIGKNCRIAKDVKITNCVIGDNCTIDEGSILTECILWNNVRIGAEADLKEDVIASDSEIKTKAYVAVGVVISDHCQIGSSATVKADVKIWPHKVVEDGATLATSLVWGSKWARNLFDAYGVSGLANIEVTPEFASKLGASYGASLEKGSYVVCSRDSHKISRMIDRAFVSGVLSAGVNVYNLQVMPIPVARYAAKSTESVGGVHIRKSPYNPNMLDFKFFDVQGMDLSILKERSIEGYFQREDYRRVPADEVGTLGFPYRGIDFYKEQFLNFIAKDDIKKNGLKVVVDYSFGSASTIFPSLLGELGCEIVSLNAYMDETKLTKNKDEFQQSLKQLSNIVATLGANLGVTLDAGAQKIFVVDELGNILDGDKAVVLMCLLALRAKPGTTISVPISASRVIEKVASDYGGQVIRCGTTYRSMMETVAQKKANLVAEAKGGYIFSEFQPVFDAMYSCVKLMEFLVHEKKPLSELIKLVPDFKIVRDHVACGFERKGAIMRRLVEDVKADRLELLDGVKIWHKDSWVLILPDMDKSFFHINAEGATVEEGKKLVHKYIKLIEDWQKDMDK